MQFRNRKVSREAASVHRQDGSVLKSWASERHEAGLLRAILEGSDRPRERLPAYTHSLLAVDYKSGLHAAFSSGASSPFPDVKIQYCVLLIPPVPTATGGIPVIRVIVGGIIPTIPAHHSRNH